MSTNANAADIDFVLREVARFSGMSFDELKLVPDDLLYMLPHPGGSGVLICGQAAARRLCAMAERQIARSRFAGRLSTNTVSNLLRTEITRRFLKNDQPIDARQADRAVSSAIRQAAVKLTNLTHVIPCHLMVDRKPDTFRIGPVTFSRRELRWPAISASLEVSTPLDDTNQQDQKEFNARIVTYAKSYYEAFDWVAEVTIENCDPEVSAERGDRMVRSALDCVHLLLGSYSDRMQIGGFGVTDERRARIALGPGRPASVGMTIGGLHNALGDGWWDHLEAEAMPIMKLMGVAIEEGYRLPDPTPLATRFLDAASWVGEAVREKNPAAKLVKCVLAIERSIITRDHKGDLAETVALRGAMLAWREDREYSELRNQMREVYDLRSKLAHGSCSPTDRRVQARAWSAEWLAQDIVVQALYEFGEVGLKDETVTSKRLEEYYKALLHRRVPN